ncbi:MAG: Tar ligand binding domain-containing protein, partial [Chloroflexota bacterium]|nr:Tar ligand binding domain-containing protein [Chloroflexota bacterium]
VGLGLVRRHARGGNDSVKLIRSLGIRLTLFGGFAGVVALFVVTAIVGITTASEIEGKLRYIGGSLFPAAEQLGQAQVRLMHAEEDLGAAAHATSQQQAADYLARSKASLDASQQALAAYRAGPLESDERQALDEFDASYRSFKPLFDRATNDVAGDAASSRQAAMELVNGQLHTVVDGLNQNIARLLTIQAARARQNTSSAAGSFARSFWFLIGVIVIGVTGAAVVGLLLSSTLTSAIGQVAVASRQIAREDLPSFVGAVRALAAGDLTQDVTVSTRQVAVPSKDELGRLAQDFNQIVDGMLETAAAFLDMRDGLRSLVTRVKASADSLAAASVKLGTGTAQSGEAVRQVARAIQDVAVNAQNASHSAAVTSDGIHQLGQAIDSVARGATEQSEQVGAVTSTTKEMVARIDQVTNQTVRVATAAEQTRRSAETGAEAVQETISGMEEIRDVVADASAKVQELGMLGQKIGAVVETIDDIAEQTNLLALNAAIEAARAGENGAGFAVVADAVGKLADRSHSETKAIAALIEQVQQGTEHAVQAMGSGSDAVARGWARADQAGKALSEIMTVVGATVAQITDIANAAQEMAASSKTVVSAMQSISGVIEQNTAATEEMAAQATEVSDAFQSIASASLQQSAATEEVSASADGMSTQVEEMSGQAEELAEMAEELKELVSRFKLGQTEPQDLPANITRLSLAG